MSATPTGLGPLVHDEPSRLDYRLRVPAPAAPAALLVLLHGVGGNEANLVALADGLDPRVLVACVRAPLELGPQQYAWFAVRFSASGPAIDAAAAEDSRQRLVRLLASLQQQHRVAPARSIVAGFSQGGILSASVALSAPQQVAGFGLLSGRILPELEPHLAPRAALATLHGYVAHGRADDKLPVSWAERAGAWLAALGVAHELRLYPGGHALAAPMAADFRRWFGERVGI